MSVENFDYIEENLNHIREKINKAASNRDNKYKNDINNNIRLLAVTKTVNAEKINFAISKGVNLIGENKVSELLEKYDKINKNGVEIHFIGNLQTNKVKYIIDKVSLIQSVNSIRLAEEINKRAYQKNIKMDVLIELNIGGEESKIGINPDGIFEFINVLKDFENLRIKGLMTIPPPIFDEKHENNVEINKYFTKMFKIFVDISTNNIDNINMQVLSMGMSDDYEEAILYGSNIVRIGRALFGERFYK
jgi:pyridoxal phosphate enzyme (YggS family)